MCPTDAPATMRVVLVDDLEDLRALLRVTLERSGYFSVVAEAENGERALAVVRETQPDLVLLDVAMPVMDGLQALALIRQEHPTVNVAMLSGFGDTSEVAQRALANFFSAGNITALRELALRRAAEQRSLAAWRRGRFSRNPGCSSPAPRWPIAPLPAWSLPE